MARNRVSHQFDGVIEISCLEFFKRAGLQSQFFWIDHVLGDPSLVDLRDLAGCSK